MIITALAIATVKAAAAKGVVAHTVHGGCVKAAIHQNVANLGGNAAGGTLAMCSAAGLLKILALPHYYTLCFTLHGEGLVITLSTTKIIAAILQWKSHQKITKTINQNIPEVKQYIKDKGIPIYSNKKAEELSAVKDVQGEQFQSKEEMMEYLETLAIDEVALRMNIYGMWRATAQKWAMSQQVYIVTPRRFFLDVYLEMIIIGGLVAGGLGALGKFALGKGIAVKIMHGGCVKAAVHQNIVALGVKSSSGPLAMSSAAAIMKMLSLPYYYSVTFCCHGQMTVVTISTKKIIAAVLKWQSNNQIKKLVNRNLPAIKKYIKENDIRIYSRKTPNKLVKPKFMFVDTSFQRDLKEWTEMQIIDEIVLQLVDFVAKKL
ncbi:hypothetical protein HDV06_006317 [Boothiomyces sp. JEL0866]|nr:hypothetical protein HDV06_006317 [Boothiomyces sp. JEL0866]